MAKPNTSKITTSKDQTQLSKKQQIKSEHNQEKNTRQDILRKFFKPNEVLKYYMIRDKNIRSEFYTSIAKKFADPKFNIQEEIGVNTTKTEIIKGLIEKSYNEAQNKPKSRKRQQATEEVVGKFMEQAIKLKEQGNHKLSKEYQTAIIEAVYAGINDKTISRNNLQKEAQKFNNPYLQAIATSNANQYQAIETKSILIDKLNAAPIDTPIIKITTKQLDGSIKTINPITESLNGIQDKSKQADLLMKTKVNSMARQEIFSEVIAQNPLTANKILVKLYTKPPKNTQATADYRVSLILDELVKKTDKITDPLISKDQRSKLLNDIEETLLGANDRKTTNKASKQLTNIGEKIAKDMVTALDNGDKAAVQDALHQLNKIKKIIKTYSAATSNTGIKNSFTKGLNKVIDGKGVEFALSEDGILLLERGADNKYSLRRAKENTIETLKTKEEFITPEPAKKINYDIKQSSNNLKQIKTDQPQKIIEEIKRNAEAKKIEAEKTETEKLKTTKETENKKEAEEKETTETQQKNTDAQTKQEMPINQPVQQKTQVKASQGISAEEIVDKITSLSDSAKANLIRFINELEENTSKYQVGKQNETEPKTVFQYTRVIKDPTELQKIKESFEQQKHTINIPIQFQQPTTTFLGQVQTQPQLIDQERQNIIEELIKSQIEAQNHRPKTPEPTPRTKTTKVTQQTENSLEQNSNTEIKPENKKIELENTTRQNAQPKTNKTITTSNKQNTTDTELKKEYMQKTAKLAEQLEILTQTITGVTNAVSEVSELNEKQKTNTSIPDIEQLLNQQNLKGLQDISAGEEASLNNIASQTTPQQTSNQDKNKGPQR